MYVATKWSLSNFNQVLTGAERKAVDGKVTASKSKYSAEAIHCNQYMNIAFLSALFAACWIGDWRPDIGRHDSAGPTCPGEGRATCPRNVAARRPLKGFHRRGIAASKANGDVMLSIEPEMPQLIAPYAMVSRMLVLSSPRTVASAEKAMGKMMDAYFAPNKTIRELDELMKSGADIDPLKDFPSRNRLARPLA